MKKFLVFVLVVIAVGVMVLIYTGKGIDDVIPLDSLKNLLRSRRSREDREIGGPSVQKFVLQDNSVKPKKTKDLDAALPKTDTPKSTPDANIDNTQVAMLDAATDVGTSTVRNPDERARELLAVAGVEGLSVTLWVPPLRRSYMARGRRVAEMIRAVWLKIGVETHIVVPD